jgi:hypothetical protein
VTKQAQKYHLSLAGEFFVAGALQRRGISAAVTYGNAKAADVVAISLNRERAVVIEVKSTARDEWVVGSGVPKESSEPWVFVFIPKESDEGPSFYVLLQSELRKILMDNDDGYGGRYKAKHGVDFTNRGVVKLKRSLVEDRKNAWQKIDELLK